MNLDFAKVCGKHSMIYEAYYKQIDPKGSGAIEAMTAAKFLKKSGLSDVVLSRVWDLSDPNGKGFLDKPGFFVALKLVSLAQSGQVINMSNIYMDTTNPPKVGDLPKIMPPRIQTVPVSSGGVANGDWSISVIDRLKYEQLFESLKPVNGMLPGNKVKGVLMDSKLPMDTLGKIWDLADQDKDGNLDKHEFIVAMHLIYQTLDKRTVPDMLPRELRKPAGGGVPPPKPAPPANAAVPRAPSGEGFGDGGFVANFPKDIAPPPAIPTIPAAIPPMTRVPPVGGPQPLISTDPLIPIGAPPSVTANVDWVVTPSELKRYEVMFRDSDRDKDGLVSGIEVKNIFLQSGVPQNLLAHIWALCDTNVSGKLTLEQFGLAMWMVERKQNGIDPPQVLTAAMVPPSMRAIVSGVDVQPQLEPKPTYTNPELEMISKEIEELAKERHALETETAQKEADIRIKSGEVRSLQSELDTLTATLKQLENQRGEAQKRLDDLKAQSVENQAEKVNLNSNITDVLYQVNKIREQCQKQEETINEQEGELNSKRSELQKLKDEETALQKEYDEKNRELQKISKHLQDTQLQISSVRSVVTELLEIQRQMTDALLMCRAAIENQEAELVTEYQLKIEPDFDDAKRTLEKKIEEPKSDPFDDNKTSTNTNINNTGFVSNGFENDPFAGTNVTNPIRTGFDDSFSATTGFDSGFDAFGSNVGSFGQQSDPFGGDAFGANKTNTAITPEPGKDDFGSDPFAALHAPTGQGQVLSPNTQKSGPPPRPESPSPALPPKKSKVPPPRPAPPRPVQGPVRTTQPTMDAFGSTSTSGGFADFDDFDNKISSIPSTQTNSSNLSNAFLTSKTTTTLSKDFAFFENNTTNTFLSSTSSPLTFESNSDTLTTNAISNNPTKRAITPLQLAASDFPTITGSTNTLNAKKNDGATAVTAVITGPTDFKDDPFKDYRYEDPFNIKDPFDDQENNELNCENTDKLFKDDLSSDDDEIKTNTSNNHLEPNISNAKRYSPLNDIASKVNAFSMNSSPEPTNNNTLGSNLVTNLNVRSSSTNVCTTGESSPLSDNAKSQRSTPAPVVTSSSDAFDNFADFDAFAANSTMKNSNDKYAPLNTIVSGTNNNSNNMDSIDFNDPFFSTFNTKTADASTKMKSSNKFVDPFGDVNASAFECAKNIGSPFDPFSINSNKDINISSENTDSKIINKTTAKSPVTIFDDFNKNLFEDDFSKIKNTKDDKLNFNFDHLNTNNNDIINQTATINDNFASFDAFNTDTKFPTYFDNALNNSKNFKSATTTQDLAKVDPIKDQSLFKLTKLQNETTLTKTLNTSTKSNIIDGNGAKLPDKFASDYSKPETFHDDLEEALKRSMLDQ
ncbi:epidermal growth factor receptor substrate 15-like 1 isoform X2 [Teleopsis dalmanni]|uniref:epidermal growth factor receptor substrate 15-like 1 isoform X2 n=1 Tax=Teleopsis dalmanni TaxID=139649 RepID=UPI0018CD8672|nr:epidermal growth factor receptor substrate 15-like 1 isoform X2 [Teleopsis dalmanni]